VELLQALTPPLTELLLLTPMARVQLSTLMGFQLVLSQPNLLDRMVGLEQVKVPTAVVVQAEQVSL
jgi:multisubunit Na+/H+ antiporter MnhF subunit